MRKYNFLFKRVFDILFAIIGILVLLPIFFIISLLIKIDSKGPVLFKQIRVGLNSEEFEIYKFRTMVVNAENLGKQITVGNDCRITKVGKFLRKNKMDELPQLFNVLKGDMSFVGPRPEVPKYVKFYNEEEREILKVRPGITDLASINYRNESEILGDIEEPEQYYIDIIMKEKIKLNKIYLNNVNIFIDIKIILKTIIKCFK